MRTMYIILSVAGWVWLVIAAIGLWLAERRRRRLLSVDVTERHDAEQF